MDIITKTFNIIIIGLIRSYQLILSPVFAGSCRHIPTCSQYAIDAIRRFGPIKGVYIACTRVLRCRPSGTSGYDPIPEKEEN